MEIFQGKEKENYRDAIQLHALIYYTNAGNLQS